MSPSLCEHTEIQVEFMWSDDGLSIYSVCPKCCNIVDNFTDIEEFLTKQDLLDIFKIVKKAHTEHPGRQP